MEAADAGAEGCGKGTAGSGEGTSRGSGAEEGGGRSSVEEAVVAEEGGGGKSVEVSRKSSRYNYTSDLLPIYTDMDTTPSQNAITGSGQSFTPGGTMGQAQGWKRTIA